jgi:adenine-specific DNA-methyltransferase
VERNFGNKTTWEKDFSKVFKNFVTEANSMIFDSSKVCRSTNESIFDAENCDYDLVYLDPPYINSAGTNETSNYLKCYHFLEGLVNYDRWEKMIDHQSPNLRLMNSQTDKYFNKQNIHESIELLINKFRRSKIVISYKMGGMPSIPYIVKVMKKYKDNVYTRSHHYSYALNRQNGNAQRNREVLIIGL